MLNSASYISSDLMSQSFPCNDENMLEITFCIKLSYLAAQLD